MYEEAGEQCEPRHDSIQNVSADNRQCYLFKTYCLHYNYNCKHHDFAHTNLLYIQLKSLITSN